MCRDNAGGLCGVYTDTKKRDKQQPIFMAIVRPVSSAARDDGRASRAKGRGGRAGVGKEPSPARRIQ
jgi:hypothetical protein